MKQDDIDYLARTGLKRDSFTSVAHLDDFLAGLYGGEARTIIVRDPETGGRKGSKPAQLGAICPRALMEVAEVAGFGADKYERYNFLKGYRYSLSFDALCRHLFAWWGGEDTDPESGKSHLAHAAWHCLALLAFKLRGKGTDDRPVE